MFLRRSVRLFTLKKPSQQVILDSSKHEFTKAPKKFEHPMTYVSKPVLILEPKDICRAMPTQNQFFEILEIIRDGTLVCTIVCIAVFLDFAIFFTWALVAIIVMFGNQW